MAEHEGEAVDPFEETLIGAGDESLQGVAPLEPALAATLVRSGQLRGIEEDRRRAAVRGRAPLARAVTSWGRITALPTLTGTRLDPAEQALVEQPRLVHQARERYEVVQALGEGGMGEVILARDHDIAREVAVKRLKASPNQTASVVRFVEEVRTVGRLEHPNIVPIHDVGVDDLGHYYYVMKRIEGETLEALVDRLRAGDEEAHARFDFRTRAQFFVEILRAIRHAHTRGIVHRDIKPANVMVGPCGEAVVMDWGLARSLDQGARSYLPVALVDDEETLDGIPTLHARLEQRADDEEGGLPERLQLTRAGELLGTPGYMSPEQASGRPEAFDERSEVYCLGVLFYELMCLHHPHEDKRDMLSLLYAVVNEDPPFATMNHHPAQPDVPAQYGHFCKKAMAKDPAERFGSVAEMIDELEQILSGNYRVQCPLTASTRVWAAINNYAQSLGERAVVLMAGVLAALLLMIVLAAFGVASLLAV